MMVGAAFTLFRMRKGLFDGLKRAISDLKVTAAQAKQASRNEQYMSSKTVFLFRAYMARDQVNAGDLIGVLKVLDERGVIEPEALEELLHQPSV